jgi:hypothetical protein
LQQYAAINWLSDFSKWFQQKLYSLSSITNEVSVIFSECSASDLKKISLNVRNQNKTAVFTAALLLAGQFSASTTLPQIHSLLCGAHIYKR